MGYHLAIFLLGTSNYEDAGEFTVACILELNGLVHIVWINLSVRTQVIYFIINCKLCRNNIHVRSVPIKSFKKYTQTM